MKAITLLISVATILILVMSGISCTDPSGTPLAFPGGQVNFDGIHSQQSVGLWVNGQGKAYGVPDVAILRLGVEIQERSVNDAQRGAAEAMDKIIKTLKSRGVADKDIQTQQFTINIVKRWLEKEGREEITGYRVVNSVVVKIRKINEAGNVIDAVGAAGGNALRINGISFTVDDPEPYFKEAREKAVADAIAKAKQIAGTAGIRLGKPIYVSENVAYSPPVATNYLKAESLARDSVPTPISAGELEFQITVQMVYTIN